MTNRRTEPASTFEETNDLRILIEYAGFPTAPDAVRAASARVLERYPSLRAAVSRLNSGVDSPPEDHPLVQAAAEDIADWIASSHASAMFGSESWSFRKQLAHCMRSGIWKDRDFRDGMPVLRISRIPRSQNVQADQDGSVAKDLSTAFDELAYPFFSKERFKAYLEVVRAEVRTETIEECRRILREHIYVDTERCQGWKADQAMQRLARDRTSGNPPSAAGLPDGGGTNTTPARVPEEAGPARATEDGGVAEWIERACRLLGQYVPTREALIEERSKLLSSVPGIASAPTGAEYHAQGMPPKEAVAMVQEAYRRVVKEKP